MINWNRLIRKTSHPRSLLAKIAAGYITVLLTVGCIIYIGIHEWREIKSIETNVRQINRQKRTIRNVYMKMLELSLFCDTFTEWDEKDFNTYLKQKSAVDSLLYGLQELHPNAGIDSIRILWRDKEQSMLQIKEIMRKQQQAGREITGQLSQMAGQSLPEKDRQEGRVPEKAVREKREDGNLPERVRTPCPQQDHCGQTAAICAPVLRAGTYPRLPQQVAQRAASTGYQTHGQEHSVGDTAAGGEAGQYRRTVTDYNCRTGGSHVPAARRFLHDYTPGHGTHKPLQEKAGGNNRAIGTYRCRKRGADCGKKKNHADRDP